MQIDDISKIVNFDSIVRVEYLKSYDRSLGVLAPEWALLDEEIFKGVLDRQSSLICRLTKVEQTVTANNILDMEPLGTLFVLGTPEITSQPTNYATFLENIYKYIRTTGNSTNPDMMNKIEIYYAQNVPLISSTPATVVSPSAPSIRAARMGPAPTGY
jgi:hypothetical protein